MPRTARVLRKGAEYRRGESSVVARILENNPTSGAESGEGEGWGAGER